MDNRQGKIQFFNAPITDQGLRDEINKIEPFNVWVESGGNVLGAATMITKGFLGSNVSIFVGADFAFGYDKKFHSWDSPYDKKFSGGFLWPNVYGIKVYTWQSYFNFKVWFETVVCHRGHGFFINATEGGILGAYQEGNIMQITQMDLAEVFRRYNLYLTRPKDQKGKEIYSHSIPDTFRDPTKEPYVLF